MMMLSRIHELSSLLIPSNHPHQHSILESRQQSIWYSIESLNNSLQVTFFMLSDHNWIGKAFFISSSSFSCSIFSIFPSHANWLLKRVVKSEGPKEKIILEIFLISQLDSRDQELTFCYSTISFTSSIKYFIQLTLLTQFLNFISLSSLHFTTFHIREHTYTGKKWGSISIYYDSHLLPLSLFSLPNDVKKENAFFLLLNMKKIRREICRMRRKFNVINEVERWNKNFIGMWMSSK